jgi:hypothetical protein
MGKTGERQQFLRLGAQEFRNEDIQRIQLVLKIRKYTGGTHGEDEGQGIPTQWDLSIC